MKKRAKISGLVFVISGPSGSGKTTLLENLVKMPSLKKELVKSISLTTRPKRTGEKDKREYFFVDEEKFKQLKARDLILEWTKYLGYHYGTPRQFIEEKINMGKHVVLCLDFKGANFVRNAFPKKTVTIFILPPSLSSLDSRIASRCKRTCKSEIGERLKLAKKEILFSEKYDYCVVNKKIEQALKKLERIILGEICRTYR